MTVPLLRIENHPFKARWVGMIVGTLLLFVLVFGSISPRTYAITPWLVVVAIVGIGVARRLWPQLDRMFWIAAAAIIAFPAWALASAAWAEFPEEAIGKSSTALVLVVAVLASVAFLAFETRANRLRIAEGLWLGGLFGAVFLAIEVWSGQAVRIAVINVLGLQPADFDRAHSFVWQDGRVVSADFGELTRIAAPLSLIAAPAILAAWTGLRSSWRFVAAGIIAAATFFAVFWSGSESAKIAFLCGLAAAGLAWVSALWTRRLLAAGWVVACLAMVPLVLGLYQLAPQNDPVVARMFQSSSPGIRLQIWHDYASWSLERPIIGHGANHTYVWGQQIRDANQAAGGPPLQIGPGHVWPHPHNMYLQVWYDLGAVGAVLFTAFGLAILWAIGRMPQQAQVAQLATFAAVAAFIPTSYGLWQPWLMGLFALVGLSAVIAGLMVERPATEGG